MCVVGEVGVTASVAVVAEQARVAAAGAVAAAKAAMAVVDMEMATVEDAVARAVETGAWRGEQRSAGSCENACRALPAHEGRLKFDHRPIDSKQRRSRQSGEHRNGGSPLREMGGVSKRSCLHGARPDRSHAGTVRGGHCVAHKCL